MFNWDTGKGLPPPLVSKYACSSGHAGVCLDRISTLEGNIIQGMIENYCSETGTKPSEEIITLPSANPHTPGHRGVTLAASGGQKQNNS